jgi:hypothetical protein
MKSRVITTATTALASTFLLTPVFAPAAQADDGLLACPGIVAVEGGYHLTQNTTCDLDWTGTSEFLDLQGHTLSGAITASGNGLTLRNGTFHAAPSYFEGDDNTLSRVRVTTDATPQGILIEAGNNFTVDHSVFDHVNASAAVDFYFGTGGRVSHSTFTATTGEAVSVQASSDVVIEHNRFVANSIGVNLWPEDGYGVANVTVAHNVFAQNTTAGVRLTGAGGLDGTVVAHNTMSRNGGPGIEILLDCVEPTVCPAPAVGVTANMLDGNGTNADALSRSGLFARGYVAQQDETPSPGNLAHVVVKGNRATRNGDLGFDATGVTDGGRNLALFNANPAQCAGVVCGPPHR